MKLQRWYLITLILILLSIWEFGNFSFIVSKPTHIFSFIFTFLQTKIFWINFLRTLGRVIISCFLALIFGVILALLKGTKLKFIYDFIYGSQFISAAVLTILFIVFFGLNPMIPIWVVTIVIIPNIYVATEIGIKHIRKDLTEFGKFYAKNKYKQFKYIILPQIIPYITNGFVRAHAVAWKVVITAELFVVAKGLGYLLNNYFRLMEFEKLFGITIIIICIGLLFDFMVRKLKEVHVRDYNKTTE